MPGCAAFAILPDGSFQVDTTSFVVNTRVAEYRPLVSRSAIARAGLREVCRQVGTNVSRVAGRAQQLTPSLVLDELDADAADDGAELEDELLE